MFDLSSLGTEIGLSAVLLIVMAILKAYVISETGKRYIPLACIIIGVILVPAALVVVKGGSASPTDYAGAAIFGLLVGYGASGLKEVTKAITG